MNPDEFFKVMALWQAIEQLDEGDNILIVNDGEHTKWKMNSDEQVGTADRDLAYEYQMDRVKDASDD
jgi:hypothetical protein|tara:strand:+ start:1234 stop:1434 length:201 start_codon:yes stop_codon:yes gene_type:complete